MLGWVLTSCVAPIAVFSVKFGLFDRSGYEVVTDELGNIVSVNPTALNGWGIISCVIVLWTVVQILKDVKDSYTGYSFIKQCIDGVLKVMPFVIAFTICFFLRDALNEIMDCLIVVIIARLVAVPLNPLPKWKFERKGIEDYEDGLALIVKYIKEKLEGGDD